MKRRRIIPELAPATFNDLAVSYVANSNHYKYTTQTQTGNAWNLQTSERVQAEMQYILFLSARGRGNTVARQLGN